ncbi:MAG: SDR family oxidoreductase [Deltaproteobacteria bacterium]|nr:SDR family oxidoreductase [Deltaproteobacteria bacterium]
MPKNLKGKVAVVTGAGRGIGRGIALLLAQEGASVVVNDLGCDVDGSGQEVRAADEVVDEIRAAGGTAVASHDSVADFAAAERIVATAVRELGRIDVLVNNAGILRDRMFFNMSEEEWDAVVGVHLKGSWNCTRHASRRMREQKSGRIISITSTSGLYGNAGQANYGAAKDGIAGLTRVVSRELGKYGITANAISPAAQTRMIATIPGMSVKPGDAKAPRRPRRPMVNDPEDIAPMVAYLATDAAANVNGQIFHVQSGMIARLSDPAPVRTMQKRERWTPAEVATIFPRTLGMDLVNPAPPRAKA